MDPNINPDILPMLLGSISMLVFAAIIVAAIYFNYKKREQAGKEIMAAIEKGMDVPLLAAQPQSSNYSRGIVWTSLGIAFTLALWFSSETLAATAWGLIPIAIGVSYLLIARREDQVHKED